MTMILILLTLLVALSLSAVAAYYSIVGLTTIFAASVIPIIIMAGVLEAGKLITTVWLHENWKRAKASMKAYLVLAVIVLMLITSMGIFGFLSRAHIEQTASSVETVAQITRVENEIARQQNIIERAEDKIKQLEVSELDDSNNIQTQIDKEQERIDLAFQRIEPAIAQQNKTIENARQNDSTRTKPYEVQLENLNEELKTITQQAEEYETRIGILKTDNSAALALEEQAIGIEENIVITTNKLQSTEREQVRAGQAVIGVSSDGLFGGNTRRALEAWVTNQRQRISELQLQAAQLRAEAQSTVDAERERLRQQLDVLRGEKTDEVRTRQREILATIDSVRATESPVIQTARDEIQRLRESAESQVEQSQTLIERLRQQLAQSSTATDISSQVSAERVRITDADTQMELLIEQKYELEIENRIQEAEVGPIKYIASLIYGTENTDTDTLENAVRIVIIMLVFVFDPLAIVLLLAATQNLFWIRQDKAKLREKAERAEYERARAQAIVNNVPPDITSPVPPEEELKFEDVDQEIIDHEFAKKYDKEMADEYYESVDEGWDLCPKCKGEGCDHCDGKGYHMPEAEEVMEKPEPIIDIDQFNNKAQKYTDQEMYDEEWELERDGAVLKDAKKLWKADNPDKTLKEERRLFVSGQIQELPWISYLDDPRINRDVQLVTEFPTVALKGDIALRTDIVPTELFKYNGTEWIPVSKDVSDAYSHSSEYINYLIEKISTGEYDPELLTSVERQEIESRLQKDI